MDGMGWDGMGWDGWNRMKEGWDGMGWNGWDEGGREEGGSKGMYG